MVRILVLIALVVVGVDAPAQGSPQRQVYPLADSLRPSAVLAFLQIDSAGGRRESHTGLEADGFAIWLEAEKDERDVAFRFPEDAEVVATGHEVELDKPGELEWEHHWSTGKAYQMMLAMAGDSAGNFALVSAYVFMPDSARWKLIGTCKTKGRWKPFSQCATSFAPGKRARITGSFSQVWCQRASGMWKQLAGTTGMPVPVINYAQHADSLHTALADKALIDHSHEAGKINVPLQKDGVYYSMLKEGTGAFVQVSDTVTVRYKGWLLQNEAVFDETKDKPATFPLVRLIKGWQIGVPLCRIGGKIRLVIPSGQAYSIRTRSPKIPPNSVLMFDIEVLDAKAAQPVK
jgi:hypothetical protein